VPDDRFDDIDLADLTDFDESRDDDATARSMKDELRTGAQHDLTAAAFLWKRHPRQAQRLLTRASDMLDWLAGPAI
jgi:hypothetical protein